MTIFEIIHGSFKIGILRLSMWICIMGLPQEYWHPRMLFEITSVVGTSLFLDNGQMVYLAIMPRILVDMNLLERLFDKFFEPK